MLISLGTCYELTVWWNSLSWHWEVDFRTAPLCETGPHDRGAQDDTMFERNARYGTSQSQSKGTRTLMLDWMIMCRMVSSMLQPQSRPTIYRRKSIRRVKLIV